MDMKFKRLISIIMMVSMLMSLAMLVSCSKKKEETPEAVNLKREMETEKSDFDDPSLANEEDGADPVAVTHDEKDFYGNWQAPSDRAAYLFGNVNLKIKKDGTWKGNVSDIKVHGKWKYDGKGIVIKDTEGYINWKLFYADDGTLVFEDLEQPNDGAIVLKPGPAVK